MSHLKKTASVRNARALAAITLVSVLHQGQPFDPAALAALAPTLSEKDLAFTRTLCFGVLRYYSRLKTWAMCFLDKSLKAKDQDIFLLLLIGLYQLFYLETPHHAALHETVEACLALKKPWAKGLINGFLQTALRQGKAREPNDPAHPAWLVARWQKTWPAWEQIIAANLDHPPYSLRINLSRITREAYLTLLEGTSLTAQPIAHCPAGIIVTPPVPAQALPGFLEGLISVQDGAAQLAAHALMLDSGMAILDACAAPGGKTAHILESQANLKVLALDISAVRLDRVKQNFARLGLQGRTKVADACLTDSWWEGECFDRILLDAPCSATGVIRRHPEIKWHRRPEDLTKLVKQQKLLLDALWPLLKPNGILVYATCSIEPEENSEQISTFLQAHPDAQEYPLEVTWGIAQKHGRQILPGQDHMDGFYYARLRKNENHYLGGGSGRGHFGEPPEC